MPTIDRHKQLIDKNSRLWHQKPLLRIVYNEMYRKMRQRRSTVAGKTVELGSGMGSISEIIPDCIRTDLFPYPWLDQTENAYQLTFEDNSLANLFMVDVFHHLRYPGTALQEFRRSLATGGRLIMMEPGLGFLGYIVYGLLHIEPIGSHSDDSWFAPKNWSADDMDYYASQGTATRIFVQKKYADRLTGWRIVEVKQIAALAYAASGGYSGPQLYPAFAYGLVKSIEKILQFFPSLFTTRLLIVLQKEAD